MILHFSPAVCLLTTKSVLVMANREEDMKRKNIGRAVLIALVIAAGLVVAAPSTPGQGRRLPTFEVDRGWPEVPPQWRVGDGSGIATGAGGRVRVLQRPRTHQAGHAG